MCGERSRCLSHLGSAPLTVCLLSRSTLRLQVALRALPRSGSRVLHQGTDFGPAFRALARSEQPRRPGPWRTHSCSRAVRLFTSRASPSGSWVCRGAPSQLRRVCPLGSWSPAATLLVDVNCPGSQKPWFVTGGLLTVWWRMRLWGRDCPSPSGSGCLPPASPSSAARGRSAAG